MAQDDLHPDTDGTIGPVDRWIEITPGTGDLAFKPVAVSVGETAGIVVVQDKEGNQVPMYFNAGDIKPVRPVKILATRTSGGSETTTADPIFIHPS